MAAFDHVKEQANKVQVKKLAEEKAKRQAARKAEGHRQLWRRPVRRRRRGRGARGERRDRLTMVSTKGGTAGADGGEELVRLEGRSLCGIVSRARLPALSASSLPR
eukprot:3603303-Prymnesium_polylepis.1